MYYVKDDQLMCSHFKCLSLTSCAKEEKISKFAGGGEVHLFKLLNSKIVNQNTSVCCQWTVFPQNIFNQNDRLTAIFFWNWFRFPFPAKQV